MLGYYEILILLHAILAAAHAALQVVPVVVHEGRLHVRVQVAFVLLLGTVVLAILLADLVVIIINGYTMPVCVAVVLGHLI